jgi:hypothetical protein
MEKKNFWENFGIYRKRYVMKKIIRLTESDLVRVVKRVITENMNTNLKFKNVIISHINKLVKGGLYIEEGNFENDDYILFRKNDNDEIVFRYTPHDEVLLYSDKINNIPHLMFSSNIWDVLPQKSELLKKIVGEWVEENLIPEFGDEIEEMTGNEFYINEIYNDENYNPMTGTYIDDDDDEY